MMAVRSAVIEVLLFFTLFHHCEIQSAVTHTLEYSWTVDTQGHFTSVGLLDGEEFMYYDSNTAKMTPKTEWIEKVETDSSYWEKETRNVEVQQDWLIDKLNQRGDTLQRVYGCEIDDKNVTRGYDTSIYNGTDFISLDLNTGTWTAVDERAKRFTEGWNPAQKNAAYWTDFLERTCVDRLKSYMPFGTKEEQGGSEGGSEGRSEEGADEGKTGTLAVVLVPVLGLAAAAAAAAAVGFVFYKRRRCGFKKW